MELLEPMLASVTATTCRYPATAVLASRHARRTVVLLCMCYVASFLFLYTWVVVPVWAYEGFRAFASPTRVVIAALLACLPSLWIPATLVRPSALMYWLLYLLAVVPACIVPVYVLVPQTNGPLYFAAAIIAMFTLISVIYHAPLCRFPSLRMTGYEFGAIVCGLSVATYALLFMSFGFSFRYLSLKDIYIVRTEFQETLDQTSVMVAYAIGWQAYVLNPLLMALGFRKRKLSWILLGIAGQFLIYSISGFRTVYFSVILMPYLFWIMNGKKPFAVKLTSSWICVLLLATALKLVGWSQFLAALVGERMTAIPGLLTAYYYQFFSSHPKAALGHSVFRAFVDYPYALEPRRIIGYTYFHDVGMSANANLWADAYANFGYAGVVLFTLLLGFVMWILDSAAVGRDPVVAALTIALPGFALANAGLLTAILTHGIGLAIVLIYLMPVRGNAIRVGVPASRCCSPARSISAAE